MFRGNDMADIVTFLGVGKVLIYTVDLSVRISSSQHVATWITRDVVDRGGDYLAILRRNNKPSCRAVSCAVLMSKFITVPEIHVGPRLLLILGLRLRLVPSKLSSETVTQPRTMYAVRPLWIQ
jgi:hypothetical protein